MWLYFAVVVVVVVFWSLALMKYFEAISVSVTKQNIYLELVGVFSSNIRLESEIRIYRLHLFNERYICLFRDSVGCLAHRVL